MKRRDFIRTSVTASVVTGTLFSMGKWTPLMASGNGDASKPFLVAVKNGDAISMLKAGMDKLGGMKAFIKAGQTVVIKPNIGWDAGPERAANTNPELVGQLVKMCLEAGASKVSVFDNTCDEWTRCYKNSGIEQAVKDQGGVVVSGKDEGMYREVSIPKGIKLKKAKVHELILDSDVFINVPVIKNHGGATMSLSMKNLMGVVWDRGFWHRTDLHQCIADFASYCKPDLTIIDGYRAMMRNGPRGVSVADVAMMKYQLISSDMVAADTAATKVFGIETEQVKHIALAEKLGVGTTNLDAIKPIRVALP
ncbi:MAG: DUF362 domain-containing protein [Bacteroidales bacterium]|nr:DUF362 domain-containing protein [Bacteroidales bacterium]